MGGGQVPAKMECECSGWKALTLAWFMAWLLTAMMGLSDTLVRNRTKAHIEEGGNNGVK